MAWLIGSRVLVGLLVAVNGRERARTELHDAGWRSRGPSSSEDGVVVVCGESSKLDPVIGSYRARTGEKAPSARRRASLTLLVQTAGSLNVAVRSDRWLPPLMGPICRSGPVARAGSAPSSVGMWKLRTWRVEAKGLAEDSDDIECERYAVLGRARGIPSRASAPIPAHSVVSYKELACPHNGICTKGSHERSGRAVWC